MRKASALARCSYCLQLFRDWELQRDHIQPRSKGGTDELDNLTPACADCNQAKSNMSLLEFVKVQHGGVKPTADIPPVFAKERPWSPISRQQAATLLLTADDLRKDLREITSALAAITNSLWEGTQPYPLPPSKKAAS